MASLDVSVEQPRDQAVTLCKEGVMVSYIGDSYSWGKYETDEGSVLYSLDLDTDWAEAGQPLYPVVSDDEGMRRLLLGGYPQSHLYGNADVDRYVTQAAVWIYEHGEGSLADDFKNGSDPYGLMDGYIIPLVNKAREAEGVKSGRGWTLLQCADGAVSDGGEGEFSSPAITVDAPAESIVSVELGDSMDKMGAYVVDDRGDERYNFGDGERLWVRIPSAAAISMEDVGLTATAEVREPYVVSYRTSLDDNYEHLVGLNDEPVLITARLIIPVDSFVGRLGSAGLFMGFVLFVVIVCIAFRSVALRRRRSGN